MSMNIPSEILTVANQLELDTMATGGGLDYVYRRLADGREAILTCYTEDGSPFNLIEDAVIIIFNDDEWMDGVRLRFSTTLDALRALSTMESFSN